jgi:hypothetical protein
VADWANTGSFTTAVDQSTAVLLQSGKVLLLGGNAPVTGLTVVCMLYDPTAGTWTATGSMNQARSNAMAVVLNSGKVLVFGGSDGSTNNFVRSSAEIYDPGPGTWATTGAMSVPRVASGFWHLADDRVLVAGGTSGGGTGGFTFSGPSLSSAEIYDPVATTWSGTGALNTARQFFGYAISGNVPVAIGGAGPTTTIITSTETYSVGGGTWTTKTACPVSGTFNDGFNNAVTLNDGTILLASGRTGYYVPGTDTGNCAVYNVGGNSWTTVTSLLQSRDEGQLYLLNDGTVLMAGGFSTNDTVFLTECEIYQPGPQIWTTTASLPDGKGAILINLGPVLANGKAVLPGGFSNAVVAQSVTTQLYTPGAPPPMAITLLQHHLKLGGGSLTISPTTAGSFLLVCQVGGAGISDTTNGSYPILIIPGTGPNTQFHYFQNSAAGVTVVTAGTGTISNFSVSEWAGVATSGTFIDQEGATTRTAAPTAVTPSITTTNAGDAVIAYFIQQGGRPITSVSTGFTAFDYDSTASSEVAYQIPGATGTFACTFGIGGDHLGGNEVTILSLLPPAGISKKKQSSMFLVF